MTGPTWPRRLVHRFVPAHYADPIGLARRLRATDDPAALFATRAAIAGLLLTPVDLVLALVDGATLARARPPELPQLFVCGPPRSGTTLVAQVLMRALPVAWFTNLGTLFPRSPLTATRWWGRLDAASAGTLRSYYGRTAGLAGPSDALHVWDRWFGSDRIRPPERLDERRREAMRRFFGAYERLTGRPLVAKNNNLNVYGHLVAEALPRSAFICLTREGPQLAQSIVQARRDIQGSISVPYGMMDERVLAVPDPLEQVCHQVLYYRRLAQTEQARIGSDRYSVVPYERFCEDPAPVLRWACRHLFAREPTEAELASLPRDLRAAVRVRDRAEFDRIERCLAALSPASGW